MKQKFKIFTDTDKRTKAGQTQDRHGTRVYGYGTDTEMFQTDTAFVRAHVQCI